MRKILLILLSFLFMCKSNSQCVPDVLYTSIGLPGVYPFSIQTPNSTLPVGVSDGTVGSNYNQTLTLLVLEDTTLDISPFIPAAAIPFMNTLGISTTMTVDINYAFFDIQDLPNGINYQCDMSTCQYPAATDGCIQLNGTPNIAGTFSVPVNMIINIQLPSINIPGFGLIGGIAQDIPAYAVQTYDLFVSGSTSVYEQDKVKIYPNPSSDIVTLSLKHNSDVIICNALGEEVLHLRNMNRDVLLNKQDIGKGLFFVNIFYDNYNVITKLIIK